jgi:DHA1 family tetracycline resistance protein-like MFS transporter
MRIKNPALLIIFLTIFIDLMGFSIIIPILPFYAKEYGADAFHIGLLGAAFSGMQFVFTPIWGRVSDRIGRRPIILFSLAGTAVSHFFFALSGSLFLLYVSRILAGIAGASVATAMAYISDVTSEEDRASGMGLVGAAFGLGFIFGPAIAGVLSPYGYSVPLFFASGLSLLAFGLAWFKLPESTTEEIRQRSRTEPLNFSKLLDAVRLPNVGLLFLIFFTVTLSFANVTTVFALFTEFRFGYGVKENGYIFAFIGIISATIQGGMIGPLVKRFGERRLIQFSIFLLSLSFLGLMIPGNLFVFMIMVAAMSIGLGIHNPTVVTLLSKSTPSEKQGGILGINQSLASLARVLGPLWGGYFYDALGKEFPLLSGGILVMLIFLVAIRLRAVVVK